MVTARLLDQKIFFLLNHLSGQSIFGDWVIIFCAKYLAYVLAALFIVWLWRETYSRKNKLKIALEAFLAVLIARFGVVSVVQSFYHRPRPPIALHIHSLLSEASYSFPSAHAASFFALAVVVYGYNKKWGSWFFVLAIIMALGRVAAGVHYPSDILAGALVGTLVGYIVLKILR